MLGCTPAKVTHIKTATHTSLILVPVTINGKTYDFLWDTGCTYSGISQKIFDQCNLTGSGDSILSSVFMTKKQTMYELTEPVNCSIGDIAVSRPLVRYYDIMPYAPSETTNNPIHGILGADVIHSFYWLFNLTGNNAIMSNEPIAIDEPAQLVLDFSQSPTKTLYCTVILNDTLKANMVLDTGMPGSFAYCNSPETIDFGYDFMVVTSDINKSLWPYLSKVQKKIKLFTAVGEDRESGRVLDSLKINNFGPITTHIQLDVDDYHKSTNDKGVQGYITAMFMRRFSKMYYDPYANKIHLYKSESDKGLYTGEELKELFSSTAK